MKKEEIRQKYAAGEAATDAFLKRLLESEWTLAIIAVAVAAAGVWWLLS